MLEPGCENKGFRTYSTLQQARTIPIVDDLEMYLRQFP